MKARSAVDSVETVKSVLKVGQAVRAFAGAVWNMEEGLGNSTLNIARETSSNEVINHQFLNTEVATEVEGVTAEEDALVEPVAVVEERELLAVAKEANAVEVAHGVEPEAHAALEEVTARSAEVSKRSLEVVDKVSVGACELIPLKVATAGQEVPTAEEVVSVEEAAVVPRSAAVEEIPVVDETFAGEEKLTAEETAATKEAPRLKEEASGEYRGGGVEDGAAAEGTKAPSVEETAETRPEGEDLLVVDIEDVVVPIAVVASPTDGVEKYEELLASQTEVKSFVEIFSDVRYEASDEIAVERTPEVAPEDAEIPIQEETKAVEVAPEVEKEVPATSTEVIQVPAPSIKEAEVSEVSVGKAEIDTCA